MLVVSLLVTAWSVFGVAVVHEYDTAHGSAYQAIKPDAVVRPDDATLAERQGDDPDWTSHYVSWDDYNQIGNAAQAKDVQFEYSVAVSVPVRAGKGLEAVTTDAMGDADAGKTGGDFTLQAFYNDVAAEANEYGSIKVVDGKDLDFQDVTSPNMLVSKAVAERSNLKVGDTVTVGNPTDASLTYEFTVSGIYEYTDDAPASMEADAAYPKYDRENVLYTSYYAFAMDGLDTTEGTGWSVPDVNVVFTLSSPGDYERFRAAVADALPEGHKVTSPNLDAYLAGLAPLDRLATTARITLACVWGVGAALLIALALWDVLPRAREIGFDLAIGATRPRVAWQFMLEVFLQTLPGLALGLVAGACCANPLGTALASGHATPAGGAVVWRVAWIGLVACLVLALAGAVRVACFRTARLLHSPIMADRG